MRDKRMQDILNYVNQERTVTFSALCKQFGTSPATMRRDLKALAEDGQLERVHGGARSLFTHTQWEYYFYPQRMVRQTEEKKLIAKRAFEEVRDGESLLLDSSTTVCELARLLAASSLHLYVITNDLNICGLLMDHPTIKLLCVGGFIRAGASHCNGMLTEYALSQIHADKVFLGVDAVDAQFGCFDSHGDEVRSKQLMVRQSRRCIVVCDHTKFLESGLMLICGVKDIDMIITDDGLDEEITKSFKEHRHLKIIRAGARIVEAIQ